MAPKPSETHEVQGPIPTRFSQRRLKRPEFAAWSVLLVGQLQAPADLADSNEPKAVALEEVLHSAKISVSPGDASIQYNCIPLLPRLFRTRARERPSPKHSSHRSPQLLPTLAGQPKFSGQRRVSEEKLFCSAQSRIAVSCEAPAEPQLTQPAPLPLKQLAEVLQVPPAPEAEAQSKG